MAIHKPDWFSAKTVMVSTAPTCRAHKGRPDPPEDRPGDRNEDAGQGPRNG